MSRYRLEELAATGGVTARTVRFYRERGLLPAPVREGRIAWYGQEHVERLRLISHLLDRGHTLSGVAELLDAWEQGSDVADLIGVERAVTEQWLDEEPMTLQLYEMVELFGSEASAESLLEAAALGYLDVRGDDVVHVSRRLLEACVALVREGIPLMTVLATARQMRTHTEPSPTSSSASCAGMSSTSSSCCRPPRRSPRWPRSSRASARWRGTWPRSTSR